MSWKYYTRTSHSFSVCSAVLYVNVRICSKNILWKSKCSFPTYYATVGGMCPTQIWRKLIFFGINGPQIHIRDVTFAESENVSVKNKEFWFHQNIIQRIEFVLFGQHSLYGKQKQLVLTYTLFTRFLSLSLLYKWGNGSSISLPPAGSWELINI